MRKTGEAQANFKAAAGAAIRLNHDQSVPEALRAYRQFMAEGSALLAASIKDVYDKLEAIHADIRNRK